MENDQVNDLISYALVKVEYHLVNLAQNLKPAQRKLILEIAEAVRQAEEDVVR